MAYADTHVIAPLAIDAPIDPIGHPESGIPNTKSGCDGSPIAVTSNASTYRIDGYSATILPNNVALVAYSATNSDELSNQNAGTNNTLRQEMYPRVYVKATATSTSYSASDVHKGTIRPDSDFGFRLIVEEDVWNLVSGSINPLIDTSSSHSSSSSSSSSVNSSSSSVNSSSSSSSHSSQSSSSSGNSSSSNSSSSSSTNSSASSGSSSSQSSSSQSLSQTETYDAVYFLSGPFAGQELHVRLKGESFSLVFNCSAEPISGASYCVDFLLFSRDNVAAVPALNGMSPLPYLYVDNLVVPLLNPQVSAKPDKVDASSYYVTVIAEAPVNGVWQLFLYSFTTHGTVEGYGWKQLTYIGENRNSRIKYDTNGNLHVVWQTMRCEPTQLCYGVLGSDSRLINNQIFCAALDKQSQLLTEIANNQHKEFSKDKTELLHILDEPLVSVTEPTPLDLTPVGGIMWTTATDGSGTANITSDTHCDIGSNPKDDQAIVLTSLFRDENGSEFDGNFSQMSYQVSFDLTLGLSGVTVLDEAGIDALFDAFISSNVLVESPEYSTNIGKYKIGSDNYLVSSSKKTYVNLIPLSGSYVIPDVKTAMENSTDPITISDEINLNGDGISLNHYLLGAVPEKIVFTATKESDPSVVISQEYYTGYFRLTLLLQTSGNPFDNKLARKQYKIVRLFGDRYPVDTSVNVKTAVHYAKLHSDTVSYLAGNKDVINDSGVFTVAGDIIILTNDEVKLAHNFFASMSAQYRRFDIGLGVPTGGEFVTGEWLPYDSNQYADIDTTIDYDNIAISGVTIVPEDSLCFLSSFDRNTNRIVVASDDDEITTTDAYNDIGINRHKYLLNFGLETGRVSLSQIPITFEGVNVSPSLSIDTCDRPHLAWQSNRNNVWEIYYTGAMDQNSPFRFDTRLTKNDSNSFAPDIAVDRYGRRFVVWHDNRNDRYQIMAARSLTNYSCDEARCSWLEALDILNVNPFTHENGGSGVLSFSFQNTGASGDFHFRISFYSDAEKTFLLKTVTTSEGIANWKVLSAQFPYTGASVNSGATTQISYQTSKEDGLSDSVYFVNIEYGDGSSFTALPLTYVFSGGAEQLPRSTVDLAFEPASSDDFFFRVTFFSDAALTKQVLQSDSSVSTRRWRVGANPLPVSGLPCDSGTYISVSYDPDVLPLNTSLQGLPSSDGLRCGITYWVTTEYRTDAESSGEFHLLDSTTIKTACSDVHGDFWGTNTDQGLWICSGQGGTDACLTLPNHDALFPRTVATYDGMAYVVWEDQRSVFSNPDIVSTEIFSGVWDIENDNLYFSGQNHFDRRITTSNSQTNRYHKPILLIDNLFNPIFFFRNQSNISKVACGLAHETETTIEETDTVYPDQIASLSSDELNTCVRLQVFDRDVKSIYTNTDNSPVQMVDTCFVRFEVQGAAGSYAVRLKNENGSWSEWLPILPELPPAGSPANPTIDDSSSSSSADGWKPQKSYFEAFFIGDNRFIVPWVLSSESGVKTVGCQVLTYSGRTNTIETDVLASYTSLDYKIDFYYDTNRAIPLPRYEGTPVASMQRTPSVITEKNYESISQTPVATDEVSAGNQATIYLTVTFVDPTTLSRLLALKEINGFNNLGDMTFDFIGQGTSSILDQPLTDQGSGVYHGTIVLPKSDGIENKDGLGVLIVNIPDPRIAATNTESVSLDKLNVMGHPRQKYLSSMQEQTVYISADDIRTIRTVSANKAIITNDRFRKLYYKELACSFLGKSCVSAQPDDDLSSSSTSAGNISESGSSQSAINCGEFNWGIPCVAEPGHYKYQPNSTVFLRESSTGTIDVRTSGSITFQSDSDLEDVLIMVRDGEDITQSWNGVLPTGGSPAGSITFTLPKDSVIFTPTQPYTIYPYRNVNDSWRNPSNQKVFNESGTAITATIPAGNSGAGGYDISIFSNAGFIVRNFSDGLLVNDLRRWGFVDSNNSFRFKFYHVACGEGHVSISGMTCSNNIDISSSSSTQRFTSSSSSESSIVQNSSSSSSSSNSSSSSSSSSLISDDCEPNTALWPFAATTVPRNECNATSFVLWRSYSIEGPDIDPVTCLPSSDFSGEPVIECPFTAGSAGGDDGFMGTYNIAPLFHGDSLATITLSVRYNTYNIKDRIRFLSATRGELWSSGCIATLLESSCPDGECQASFDVTEADSPLTVYVDPGWQVCNEDHGAGWWWVVTCGGCVGCGDLSISLSPEDDRTITVSDTIRVCTNGKLEVAFNGNTTGFTVLMQATDSLVTSYDVIANTMYITLPVNYMIFETLGNDYSGCRKVYSDGLNTYVQENGCVDCGSDDLTTAGFTVYGFGDNIPVSTFDSLGWIDSDHLMTLKFVHITTGVTGALNLSNCSCVDESSSSLSSASSVSSSSSSTSLSSPSSQSSASSQSSQSSSSSSTSSMSSSSTPSSQSSNSSSESSASSPSSQSSSSSSSTVMSPPSAPSFRGVVTPNGTEDGSQSLVLTWTNGEVNYDSIDVLKSDNGVDYVVMSSLAGNAITATDATFIFGTTKYYIIRGIRGVNNADSGASNTIRTVPAAPGSLSLTVLGEQHVRLVWSDLSINEDGYVTSHCTDDATWIATATVGRNVTSYDYTTLSACTVYYFKLRSFNYGGYSAYSNKGSANTPGCP